MSSHLLQALSPIQVWVLGARVRTLPAAISPVLIGSALAIHDGVFDWVRFVATLVGALSLQVGANFINDYSDSKRGADSAQRVGPPRVTALGLAAPERVLAAAWVAFAAAAIAGGYLAIVSGWELFAVGLLAIAAAALYTGGPKPYGYLGLGEVFVFIFFGLVAVCGTYWAQTGALNPAAFVCATIMGLCSVAILVVNNLRDIDSDKDAKKKTLAVRLGRQRTRILYVTVLAAAFVILAFSALLGPLPVGALLGFLAGALLAPGIVSLVWTARGAALNQALAATAKLQLVLALLLACGILWS